MKLLLAPCGDTVLGEAAQHIHQRKLALTNIIVGAEPMSPAGDFVGMALKLSDGSVIGAILNHTDARIIIDGLQRILAHGPFVPPAAAPVPTAPEPTPALRIVRDSDTTLQ